MSSGRRTAPRAFSTAQVARLTGLAPARLRAWARSGLVEPAEEPRGRGLRWSWIDLVGLRTLAVLHLDHRIPVRRLRRLLPALREVAGDGSGLAALARRQLAVTGDSVVLVDTARAYDAFVDLLAAPGQQVLAIMPMEQVIWDLRARLTAAGAGGAALPGAPEAGASSSGRVA